MQTASQIISTLEAAGFRAAFLPYSAMEQIREHYDTLLERGPDTKWLRDATAWFHSNEPPKLEFEPRSFLVMAFPCARATLVLRRDGKRIEVPIPPGYVNLTQPKQRLDETLAAAAEGYQWEPAKWWISQKLLAVLSGLGQYGRNNICYVGDWGSYICLESRYTDIPYEGVVNTELRMKSCETCGLCQKACPTGSIGEKQVIDASRCLCNLNENKDRMPRWLDQSVHHTLIGCMRCQECCPQNPPADFSASLELGERETRQLLSRRKRLPRGLSEKLDDFGFDGHVMQRMIKRNARLVLGNMTQ